jgi:hypothetical protein
MQDVKIETSFDSRRKTAAADAKSDRLSPSVPGGLVRAFAGLLAEEISALRKLAHNRRAVSVALFCRRARLSQISSPHPRIGGGAEPACGPGPIYGSLGEVML